MRETLLLKDLAKRFKPLCGLVIATSWGLLTCLRKASLKNGRSLLLSIAFIVLLECMLILVFLLPFLLVTKHHRWIGLLWFFLIHQCQCLNAASVYSINQLSMVLIEHRLLVKRIIQLLFSTAQHHLVTAICGTEEALIVCSKHLLLLQQVWPNMSGWVENTGLVVDSGLEGSLMLDGTQATLWIHKLRLRLMQLIMKEGLVIWCTTCICCIVKLVGQMVNIASTNIE